MEHTNNLRKIRDERNKSVQEICEFLNISPQYYYNLEKSNKRLNEDVIHSLADFYGVSTDYILGRVEGKNNIVLEGDSIPEELKGYVDAISVLKEHKLSKEDLEKIIEATKLLKGIK